MPKRFSTPGPRAIYPDACTSRSLAACSVEAQLLFDRLIAQSDDQGRFEGAAGVVKSLCVPLVERLTVRAIGRCLAELEANDHLHRYACEGRDLIQLVTWWHWQAGQRRAYPSKWPAPEGWIDAVYGIGGETPATYLAWVSAASCGSAPHNAAFRRPSPQDAAPRGDTRLAAALTRAPAQPLPVPVPMPVPLLSEDSTAAVPVQDPGARPAVEADARLPSSLGEDVEDWFGAKA